MSSVRDFVNQVELQVPGSEWDVLKQAKGGLHLRLELAGVRATLKIEASKARANFHSVRQLEERLREANSGVEEL